MKSAHRDLGIGASDWDIFRAILGDTLDALRVPGRERQDVMEFAESLKPDIVHEGPGATR